MTESPKLSELFADVAQDIQQSIRELGWHSPTPVQAAAIPKMREGGDLIVQAQTGSGKTGAFGIPLVEAIETDSKDTQAIVLLPTRELANQVAIELEQLGQHRGVRTLPIYGGVAYGPQLEGLEKGAHIIVGTPGRILDHLKNGRMDLSRTKVLVLDEADEMLSLGFWPDMKEVASFLPKKRQSHLFSATMPEKVRSLSRFFLNDPEDVTIEVEGGSPQRIEHYYYLAAASEKEALLARIIEYEDPESAIIFCNTKADVRFITAYLAKRGLNIDQISGDLAQAAREKAIAKIKAGKLRFLVATDVAARGIDISDLAYVINYTTSDSPEVYVHRTGRTGRAGKSGVAISIVSGLDIGNFKHMQIVSGIKISEKKAPTDRDLARRAKRRAEAAKKGKPAQAEATGDGEPEPEISEPNLKTPDRPSSPEASELSQAAANLGESTEEESPAPSRRRRRKSASSSATPDGDHIKTLKTRADQALAELESDDMSDRIDQFLPFVRHAAETEEGFRELAGICAALITSNSVELDRDSVETKGASKSSEAPKRRRRRSRTAASSDGSREDSPRSSVSDDDAGRAERPPRSRGDGRESSSGDRPRRRRRSGNR